jgi:hypothetical protein
MVREALSTNTWQTARRRHETFRIANSPPAHRDKPSATLTQAGNSATTQQVCIAGRGDRRRRRAFLVDSDVQFVTVTGIRAIGDLVRRASRALRTLGQAPAAPTRKSH